MKRETEPSEFQHGPESLTSSDLPSLCYVVWPEGTVSTHSTVAVTILEDGSCQTYHTYRLLLLLRQRECGAQGHAGLGV